MATTSCWWVTWAAAILTWSWRYSRARSWPFRLHFWTFQRLCAPSTWITLNLALQPWLWPQALSSTSTRTCGRISSSLCLTYRLGIWSNNVGLGLFRKISQKETFITALAVMCMHMCVIAVALAPKVNDCMHIHGIFGIICMYVAV